jgi:glycine oxidase
VTTFDEKRKRGRSSRRWEVLVVGAGVIGLSIGWRARRRGFETLVLDARRPARGATHAAAGMLAPVSEATFGEERQLALNLEAARSYPQFVAELESQTGAAIGYRPSGTLTVALDRDDEELLRQLYGFQRSRDLDVEWLTGPECRALEPALAPNVVGGIRSALDRQVSARALGAALAEAVGKAGGELRVGAAVRSLIVDSDRVTGVELESGERIEAEKVVVAAGWRSGELAGLPESARVPVRPVKGQILRLRGDPRAPIASRVVGTPEVYIVPRADGRVVVGATVEERGPDTTVTAGGVFELLRAAYEALPGIAELELIETTAGLRPAAPDNGPIVGHGACGTVLGDGSLAKRRAARAHHGRCDCRCACRRGATGDPDSVRPRAVCRGADGDAGGERSMRIVLNGENRELPGGATVAELVEQSGLARERRRGVAVAVEGEVVPRSAWGTTELSEGQAVELLTAIQGG